MVSTRMIRISQKTFPIDQLKEVYSAIQKQYITIKRVFDPRYSISGDDIIIEGDIDKVLENLSHGLLNFEAVRFSLSEGTIQDKLEKKSAITILENNRHYFFGTAMVDYDQITQNLMITERDKILSLLFRSKLGSVFKPLMPVKVKGLVVVNNENNTVEFVLPTQRIETLKKWIYELMIKDSMTFKDLSNILEKTDLSMKREYEDSLNWIQTQLPELLQKSTTIENIDIISVYKKAMQLVTI